MIQWIKKLFRSIENPSVPLSNYDEWSNSGVGISGAGIQINRDVALTYSPVWRAVNLISKDVAKLPLYVYKRTPDGKEKYPAHPAFNLLRHKPNEFSNAFVLKMVMTTDVLLNGNGYAFINRQGDGLALGLYRLDPDCTYPVIKGGKLWYNYELPNQKEQTFPADSVFHLRGIGWDTCQGYSLLSKARESIGLGLALQDYGSTFFKNNAKPDIALKHPGQLSDQAMRHLRESWLREHGGPKRAHRPAILEEGMDIKELSINAKDSQLIEQRDFEVKEVARWFGIPPHKLGNTDNTSYASLEQENLAYLYECLDPWLVAWEEECRDKLLSEQEKDEDSAFFEFDRNELVRADIRTRYAAYDMALKDGWMSKNEVRDAESLNKIEGGDEYGSAEPNPFNPTQQDSAEEDSKEEDK